MGIELIAADISGQQASLAAYPYLGHTANQLMIAPSGDLIAVGLRASQIMIMDTQGRVQAEFDGTLLGWRPGR